MATKQLRAEQCSKSEIMYDVLPREQVVIVGDYTAYYGPISALNDGTPLQFDIKGAGTDYLDPSDIYLKLKVKITKADGKNIESTNAVAPINDIGNAMFSNVDLVMNNVVVSETSNMYGAKCYGSTLFSLPQDVKDTHLFMEGWHADQATKFDDALNTGYQVRRDRFALSKEVELKTKIHTDLSFQNRLIPSGIDLRMTLTRARDNYCLQSFDTVTETEPQEEYKLKITHAELQVRKVKLEPSCQLHLEKRIISTGAHFPVNHIVMKSYNIPSNSSTHVIDGLYNGQTPVMCMMGLTKNTSHNGDWKTTPWNYQHFDLNFLELNVEGTPVPSHPLQPDYAGGQYMDCFDTIYRGNLLLGSDMTHGVTYSDYKDGYCLYCFNLTPDKSDGSSHVARKEFGNVRLALRFAKATTETLTLVVLGQFSNVITIHGNRQVVFDYAR